MPLWLLLVLVLPAASSRLAQLHGNHQEHLGQADVVTTSRPSIYFCRSPNFEEFSCWWHPLNNLTDEKVTYVLTYSKNKEPRRECPDYVTAGPNSCHFDSRHTTLWYIYCMTVTAVTTHMNYTSSEHCLDVAEIGHWSMETSLSRVGQRKDKMDDSSFGEVLKKSSDARDEVATTTRPHIYLCRSPNMEKFSCWWHPLNNLTDGEKVTYVLTYSKDKGPIQECPNYVTAGPNSCHFDSRHTTVWNIYCMRVTAVTTHMNYTSSEHCLDVADIVQTEAPVNLTYVLKVAGGDEMGYNVLLSWLYPVPSDLKYGWITLVYELHYRRLSEPDNWKVKHPLKEPKVELLGLPISDYVVRVRCRSHHHGHWSAWSSPLLMSMPTRPPTGKLLVLILVTGVGLVALLVIAFGVIPQSKRIKDYFLPPIPKPRIIGIDPVFLKKGNLDEINRHFSNFHSYRPPSYMEEVWDQVSADNVYLTSPKDYISAPHPPGRDAIMAPHEPPPVTVHHLFTPANPGAYTSGLSPYCSEPPEAFLPPDAPRPWLRPEIVSLPGTDYSLMGLTAVHPPEAPAAAAAAAASCSPQDFYTCVQLMNESGEVHLVPCLPPAYCEFPPPPTDSAKEEQRRKLASYQARKAGGKEEGEKSEAAVPLLPVAVENKG